LKKSEVDRIAAHEELCLIRYNNIEKRLEEGSSRFDRLENMMWGVYPFILVCLAVAKFG
jgi:hypothetical protein